MASETLFVCTPEIENDENDFLVYEEKFNADTETNYIQFLRTTPNMNPMVSTQKTASQKLKDIRNIPKVVSNRLAIPYEIPKKQFPFHKPLVNNVTDIGQAAPIFETEQQPSTSTSVSASTGTDTTQENLTVLMKAVLREVKLLRAEVKQNKCKCSCETSVNQAASGNAAKLLGIPADSAEDFKNFEDEIKNDNEKEQVFVIIV